MKQIILAAIALLALAQTIKAQQMNNTVFIDKITVPVTYKEEFVTRMKTTQHFLPALPGFISQATYERTDEEGHVIFITVTVWKDQAAIDNAQQAVEAEYKRTGFDRAAFNKKMNITREGGGVYQQVGD
jgi:heme-degrading monooxygenase HmoA